MSGLNLLGMPVTAFRGSGGPPIGHAKSMSKPLAHDKQVLYADEMNKSQSKSDDNSDSRTRWAEDRTILSNERTFSSWMGMGLGSIGVAIGLQAVFGAVTPTWAAKAVATLFLAISIVIFFNAQRQACRTLKRLSDNDVEAQSPRNFQRLALAFCVATVGTGIVLWLI